MTAERKLGRYAARSATAGYLYPNAEPPAWFVEIVPGARAAREKWQAENAKGDALMRAHRTSSTELAEFRRLNPPAAELEAAERAHAEKERAMTRQARIALAALEAFDDLVLDARDAGDFTASAAKVAADAHRDLVEAWDRVRAALSLRDSAWRASGAPGRDWVKALPNPLDRFPTAERIIGTAVDRFDVAAVDEIAATGSTSTPAHGSVTLPDGRTLSANPAGPFAPPIVTEPIARNIVDEDGQVVSRRKRVAAMPVVDSEPAA